MSHQRTGKCFIYRTTTFQLHLELQWINAATTEHKQMCPLLAAEHYGTLLHIHVRLYMKINKNPNRHRWMCCIPWFEQHSRGPLERGGLWRALLWTQIKYTRMPGGNHSHVRTQSNIYSSKLRTAFRRNTKESETLGSELKPRGDVSCTWNVHVTGSLCSAVTADASRSLQAAWRGRPGRRGAVTLRSLKHFDSNLNSKDGLRQIHRFPVNWAADLSCCGTKREQRTRLQIRVQD